MIINLFPDLKKGFGRRPLQFSHDLRDIKQMMFIWIYNTISYYTVITHIVLYVIYDPAL